ncbi:DUF2255 family protein [Crenobacter intestini]|uniref:DUF2255 family protein n=1 Tax=Crenobacter intestini TaxID=2563443 RepID=A0A4T0UVF7_9NEIS|nr:DUF2255 family protein [Crenobacter intestini]TIC83050.1 DUF2255 family protein [Crenobacter intestini]
MTIEEIRELVAKTETPQIRAGEHHHFNDIWIVEAKGRLFCRQYSFAKKSWYDVFLQDPIGAVRCGDQVFAIKAQVPDDLEQIGAAINEAYLDKYANRFQSYPDIARQMTGSRYMSRTMELVPVV